MLNTTMFIVDYPFLECIFKYLRYMAYIFFLIKAIYVFIDYILKIYNLRKEIIKNKLFIFTIAIIFLLYIFAIINLLYTKNKDLVILLTIMMSSLNIEIEDLIILTGKMQFASIIFVIFSYTVGLVSNYVTLRSDGTCRNSLGFGYTSNLSTFFLFGYLVYLYNKDFDLSFEEISIFEIISLLIFFITDSKTQLICEEFIILLLILKRVKILPKIKNFVLQLEKYLIFVFPFYPIFSFIIGYCYKFGGFFIQLNNFFSNRIILIYKAISNYGIPIIGTDIQLVGNGVQDRETLSLMEYNYLDNSYMQILYKYGLIILICLSILILITLLIIYNKKEFKLLTVYLLVLTFSLINPWLLSIITTPIIIGIFSIPIKYIFDFYGNNNKY
ncbi:MAG: hypothetical protein LUF02_06045, partial [Erysipelotrichaceae bacterium]|nr:hypothetical protein [Erysipelotrichaceae bacterium]